MGADEVRQRRLVHEGVDVGLLDGALARVLVLLAGLIELAAALLEVDFALANWAPPLPRWAAALGLPASTSASCFWSSAVRRWPLPAVFANRRPCRAWP
ncbi:MAG: hypothetical protein ACLUW6_05690 [Coriobacteriaceae bacterium]